MIFDNTLMLFGSLLMVFAVLLLIGGVRSRGFVRTRSFTSSGPVWFVIFMFGAFLIITIIMLP
jgi:hypothetical protein